PGLPNLLRPPIACQAGAGILTRFPSATTLVLTLGADSPCADERGAGNLGLSASGPFTRFIATHVSIRTSDTSSSLSSHLHRPTERSPTNFTLRRACNSAISVSSLSPVTSSAQDDSTSEVLRFL